MEKEALLLVKVDDGVKYLERHHSEMMRLFTNVQRHKILNAVKHGYIGVSYCLGDCPADLPPFRLIATARQGFAVYEKYGLDLSKCKIFHRKFMEYTEVKQEFLKRGFQKIGARYAKEVDLKVFLGDDLSERIVTANIHLLAGKYRIVIDYKGISVWEDVERFGDAVDIDFFLTDVALKLGKKINNESVGNIVASFLTRRNHGK